MRTLVLLMAALFLAAGLASRAGPGHRRPKRNEGRLYLYFPDRRGRVVIRA